MGPQDAKKRISEASIADPALLDKIDKLFALGIGNYIALPQIVVVGDQSSGKSSVLQALVKLAFPRDSGLCTRFATQITFRRAVETSISFSIIAANNASEEHKARVQAWSKPGLEDLHSFAEIMEEVQGIMGIGNHGTTFSEDILKLEVSSPDQEHFSVVDVPGIFRKTTEGVTTKQDREMVRAMVHGYMENPRSIMLAVIPANVDIATQEILEMAKEVDPDGLRTLGVLTKPDLVDKGAETSVLDLVRGLRHRLTLGWSIVRNPGQSQLDDPSTDRASLERAFFQTTSPWNTLDKDRVGIDALRHRLQEVLTSTIRNEFPKVKADISKLLKIAEHALDSLGAKRETTAEQLHFLTKTSVGFQEIVDLALDANYVRSDWFDEEPDLKLATRVVTRGQRFEEQFREHGHCYQFSTAERREIIIEEEYPDTPSESIMTPVREICDHPDLGELDFVDDEIADVKEDGILNWISEIYIGSRGFELGTFDSRLLATTMKTQSSKWHPLALGYISDIVNMTHTFIKMLLERVCPDKRIRENLLSTMMETLNAKYQASVDHVHFLLKIERMETPTTLNHYFTDNLEKSRQERMRKKMEGIPVSEEEGKMVLRIEEIISTHTLSNTEHLVQDIHDILKAYYKVASKRFVDNVCMQAAHYHLITGPETPLRLFSPAFVSKLHADQLEEIAGEDLAVKRKRETLTSTIENLKAGKKILL